MLFDENYLIVTSVTSNSQLSLTITIEDLLSTDISQTIVWDQDLIVSKLIDSSFCSSLSNTVVTIEPAVPTSLTICSVLQDE